jgi:hypothetical protein
LEREIECRITNDLIEELTKDLLWDNILHNKIVQHIEAWIIHWLLHKLDYRSLIDVVLLMDQYCMNVYI